MCVDYRRLNAKTCSLDKEKGVDVCHSLPAPFSSLEVNVSFLVFQSGESKGSVGLAVKAVVTGFKGALPR